MKKKSGVWRPEEGTNNSRRKFLAYSGATLAVSGLILSGCGDDDDPIFPIDKPDAPTNLTADNSTTGQVVLNWEDNMADEDGYKIERSLTNSAADFTEIASVGEDVETYTDMSVDEGVEYFYRVRTFEGSDFSDYSNIVSSVTGTTAVNFGTGDVGILNYAYALEQLEAAFYTAVLGGAYYDGASAEEKEILQDLQYHEVIHREFFKAAIPAEAIIPGLAVDFSTIDFASRDSVLGTAKAFEDLGVSAYNGAGQFFSNTDAGRLYLTLAGKIVSVEARHASAIRDLLNPNSRDFAGDDIINASGLEITRSPQDVLGIAGTYISTALDASGLPTGGYQVTV